MQMMASISLRDAGAIDQKAGLHQSRSSDNPAGCQNRPKKRKKSDFGAKRVRRGIMAAVGKGKLEKYASYQSSDDDTKEQKEVRTEGVYSADLARQIKCVR